METEIAQPARGFTGRAGNEDSAAPTGDLYVKRDAGAVGGKRRAAFCEVWISRNRDRRAPANALDEDVRSRPDPARVCDRRAVGRQRRLSFYARVVCDLLERKDVRGGGSGSRGCRPVAACQKRGDGGKYRADEQSERHSSRDLNCRCRWSGRRWLRGLEFVDVETRIADRAEPLARIPRETAFAQTRTGR